MMKKYNQNIDKTINTFNEPAVAYQSMHHSFNDIIKIDIADSYKYLDIIKKGVNKSVLEDFMQLSHIHIDLMADILHINSRTIRRLKENDLLNSSISERLVELIRLYKLGHDIFGDVNVFNTWMDRCIKGIGYKRPLDIVDTSIGVDIVMEELQRIVYGVHA